MSANAIHDVIHKVQMSEPHVVEGADLTPPMVLQSEIKPPVDWRPAEIETALQVKLPDEVSTLWNSASEIHLLSDVNYGQWGCILWSPAEVVARHKQAFGWRGPDDFRRGDLIIGEFRGDTDLVVLRCDPSQQDFGSIVIALGMDPRDDWPWVASSIAGFMTAFLAHPDKMFWEPGG